MMKKKMIFIVAIINILLCLAIPGSAFAVSNTEVYVDPGSPFRNGSFTGIWIGAYRNLTDAESAAYEAPYQIGPVQIFLSTDWSNLNPEPWYVLTAGMYSDRMEAGYMLSVVQSYYPDAYIKDAGTRTGSFSGNVSGSGYAYESLQQPFYGIWCQADKSMSEAERYADQLRRAGITTAKVFLTTDWSNLNKEPWYVVTAGVYTTETEAENNLSAVKVYYPDAYVKYSGSYIGDSRNTVNAGSEVPSAFYGIWCQADKSRSEAEKYAQQLRNAGFSLAKVFLTTDWSNLNPEPWYVVTAGIYSTQAEAEAVLNRVKQNYPDAYVKYSGIYIR